MAKRIWVSGGDKGGVGKSMLSIGLIDLALEHQDDPILIESDTSNPDVYKMHKDEIKTELIDLDDANGWIDFINVCDRNPDSLVIVNTAARNNRGVAAYGSTLSATLGELDRELITLWVINRQRDSLELLSGYMADLAGSKIHVVRNTYYGAEEKFELYNHSKLRNQVEAAGGKSLSFPDLADRVSDDLYSKRLSVRAAMKSLPLGNRAELTRWRLEVHKVLGGAMYA
jgi:hypothetical protein